MDTLYLVFKDRFSIRPWMLPNRFSCSMDGLFSPQANAHSNESLLTCQAHCAKRIKRDCAALFPSIFAGPTHGTVLNLPECRTYFLLPLFSFRGLPWRCDPQDPSIVTIKTVLDILQLFVFVLDPDRESLVKTPALDPQRQISL